MMVSVHYRELRCKVEKLKYKELEVVEWLMTWPNWEAVLKPIGPCKAIRALLIILCKGLQAGIVSSLTQGGSLVKSIVFCLFLPLFLKSKISCNQQMTPLGCIPWINNFLRILGWFFKCLYCIKNGGWYV